jgi:hypothetical protein
MIVMVLDISYDVDRTVYVYSPPSKRNDFPMQMGFDDEELKQFVVWLKQNKPVIFNEIFLLSPLSLVQQDEIYFPITAHELNLIKNDCLHPELVECSKDCTVWNEKEGMCDFSANILMDTILTRSPCVIKKE